MGKWAWDWGAGVSEFFQDLNVPAEFGLFVTFMGISTRSGGVLGLKSLTPVSGVIHFLEIGHPWRSLGVARRQETHEGPPHPHQEVGCPLPPVPPQAPPQAVVWVGTVVCES